MTETSAGELCRLVVTGPTSRVDLSVPVHVPVADLLPALLHGLGADLADRGLEHSGWILQRLGEPPLDENLTLDELGLVDGEALHMRPRSEQIPPLDFDDLIDGIATGIGRRSGLWRPEQTRLAALIVSGICLFAGAAVLCLDGPVRVRSSSALAAALALLIGVYLAAVRARDRAAATILATGAVVFAALAGTMTGIIVDRAAPDLDLGVGAPMIGGGVLGGIVGLTAIQIVHSSQRGAWRTVLLLVATTALIVGLLQSYSALSVDQVSALVIVFVAALRSSVPLLAFRLAGLRLPPLPVSPDDLQADIDPEPGAEVLAAAAAVDAMMTALQVGLGIISGVAMVSLAGAPGWLAPTTVLIAAAIPLLALRMMTSGWQRLALGTPSLIGILATVLALASRTDPSRRALIVFLVLVTAGVISTAAHTLPQRPLTPIWGRIGDVLHVVFLVALLPLALGVLGGYAKIRGMVG